MSLKTKFCFGISIFVNFSSFLLYIQCGLKLLYTFQIPCGPVIKMVKWALYQQSRQSGRKNMLKKAWCEWCPPMMSKHKVEDVYFEVRKFNILHEMNSPISWYCSGVVICSMLWNHNQSMYTAIFSQCEKNCQFKMVDL